MPRIGGVVTEPPEAFTARMTEVLGSQAALEEALEATTRPAVRVNTLKTSVQAATERLEALGFQVEPSPFCKESLFYEDPRERAIGTLWEHQNGWLFSQDAASTLPVVALDPQPHETVLDLCSAPGGKATHISQRMGNQGLLVANDSSPGRVNNMISNIDRLGNANICVTSASGARLRWPITFDKVLVDAPCSNLGKMHTTWAPVFDHNEDMVGHKVGLQRMLLETAFHAVRPGGRIVYSTCTLEPRENEEMVAWMLETFPVTVEALDLGVPDRAQAVVDRLGLDPAAGNAGRVHPGDLGTDGFFLASFTKDEDIDDWPEGRTKDWGGGPFEAGPEGSVQAVAEAYELDDPTLAEASAVSTPNKLYATTVPDLEQALQLQPDRLGVYLAKRESDGYRMSFDAATAYGRGAGRSIELDEEDALAWISGQEVEAPGPAPWSIVTHEGEPLGCARAFGDRLPCYVPKVRRVPGNRDLCGFLA